MLQPPQFLTSLPRMLVSQPSFTSPLQSSQPKLQVSMAQAPETHLDSARGMLQASVQPSTQASALQTLPSGQSSSTRQRTQAWMRWSQWPLALVAPPPPSGVPPSSVPASSVPASAGAAAWQSESSLQPGAQL